MEKALIAYLWDDAPAALRARVPGQDPPPHVLVVVPARWGGRVLAPPMLSIRTSEAGV